MNRPFYITTPIYYVNDVPHIGHAYTSILADVLARWHKLAGDPVFFLTGTDEHGQKVQEAAAKLGLDPKAHCDRTSARFREMGDVLSIETDRFIRTTDADHMAFVSRVMQALWDKGEIYQATYKGLYNVRDERFYSEADLREGRGPAEGEPVETVEEINYFFRMSAYQERLIAHIEANPDWIVPDFRRNEVLGFLRKPLGDLCISRPKRRLSWGIPLPFDPEYVTYVWFDALLNYASGVAPETLPADKRRPDGQPWWPASVHLIGKDILTTHSVYWPTMLMGAGMELPKQILAHGWWLADGVKMSKSLGNVVDPIKVVAEFGAPWGQDAFRFFLMREMVVGQDASFSHEAFLRRVDGELANDVGNLLSRIHKQVASNFGGALPALPASPDERAINLQAVARETLERVPKLMSEYRVSVALDETLALARALNRYLEETTPWHLAKDPARRDELAAVLATSAEGLRLVLTLLSPYAPGKALEGLARLSCPAPQASDLAWGARPEPRQLLDGPSLFPRMAAPKTPGAKPAPQPAAPADPFARLDLRVARIDSALPHPDAEKLWILQVDLGELGKRQVCAGIRAWYPAEQLAGRSVVLLANLKPTKLRGQESAGMVLAADGPEGSAILLAPPAEAAPGTPVEAAGIVRAPALQVKIGDFEAAPLSVTGKQVLYRGQAVAAGGQPIRCEAEDGAPVH